MQRSTYNEAVAALADPARTTLVLVARPDRPALAEAGRAVAELDALGIQRQQLVVNGLLSAPLPGDPVAQSYAEAQQAALKTLPEALVDMPAAYVELVGVDLVETIAAGPARAILVTGKGGVGKTTVALRLALGL